MCTIFNNTTKTPVPDFFLAVWSGYSFYFFLLTAPILIPVDADVPCYLLPARMRTTSQPAVTMLSPVVTSSKFFLPV